MCHSRYQGTVHVSSQKKPENNTPVTADTRAHQYVCHSRYQSTLHVSQQIPEHTTHVPQQIPEHSTCVIADTRQQYMCHGKYQSTLSVSQQIPEHSPCLCHCRYNSTSICVTADTREHITRVTAHTRAHYACQRRYQSTVHVSQKIPEHTTCATADTRSQYVTQQIPEHT